MLNYGTCHVEHKNRPHVRMYVVCRQGRQAECSNNTHSEEKKSTRCATCSVVTHLNISHQMSWQQLRYEQPFCVIVLEMYLWCQTNSPPLIVSTWPAPTSPIWNSNTFDHYSPLKIDRLMLIRSYKPIDTMHIMSTHIMLGTFRINICAWIYPEWHCAWKDALRWQRYYDLAFGDLYTLFFRQPLLKSVECTCCATSVPREHSQHDRLLWTCRINMSLLITASPLVYSSPPRAQHEPSSIGQWNKYTTIIF